MGAVAVTRDQFEITEETITHKPTGICFTRRPQNWLAGSLKQGRQDNSLLIDGEYDPVDVKLMIRQIAEELSRMPTQDGF
jgi:hypothetical protein